MLEARAAGWERRVTTMGPCHRPFTVPRPRAAVELTPVEVPVSVWSEPTKPPFSTVQSDALLVRALGGGYHLAAPFSSWGDPGREARSRLHTVVQPVSSGSGFSQAGSLGSQPCRGTLELHAHRDDFLSLGEPDVRAPAPPPTDMSLEPPPSTRRGSPLRWELVLSPSELWSQTAHCSRRPIF